MKLNNMGNVQKARLIMRGFCAITEQYRKLNMLPNFNYVTFNLISTARVN